MNTEYLNNIVELLQNANDAQRQEIANMLSNMNVQNRNNEQTKNFTEKILQKENPKNNMYLKFLESSSVNALIWAPTQVGKSDSTREFIETCLKAGVPVIVSTDNKTDQCEQLYARIERGLCGADVTMLKVSDKSFGADLKQCIESNIHRLVIFCLDNGTQIEKLIVNITSLASRCKIEMSKIKKFAFIHDEADQITKDNNTEEVKSNQAVSHRKWLELMNLINQIMGYVDLKRVFVTATPENCCMLYKIDAPDVLKLEIPSTYVGYKDIEYIAFQDDLDMKGILENETQRIKGKGSYEVILYCIERKVVNGHDKLLYNLATFLNCVVNTYNGNGITAFMRDFATSEKFESLLKKDNLKYKRKDTFFTIKSMAIRSFYTMCKKLEQNCVVTIGKDLISRGISYVSVDKHEPLTATTMIYKPGTSMHAVGIDQTIGRITGCAMPSLIRRLYAPNDVIETYKTYNRNQEAYISRIENESALKLTQEIINDMTFEKITRNIDRPKLKLNMKMDGRVNDYKHDEDEVKHKIDLWWNDNSIIGRVLKCVYNKENGICEEELLTYIQEWGSNSAQSFYINLFHHNLCGIFVKLDGIVCISNNARTYISSSKQT